MDFTGNKIYKCGDEIVKIYKCGEVVWEKPRDYSQEYLTLEILTDGNLTLKSRNERPIYYSVNNGDWVLLELPGSDIRRYIAVSSGDTVQFKGTLGTAVTAYYDIMFGDSTAWFNAYGNIMSLIYGDDFYGQTTFPAGCTANFQSFFGTTSAVSAENLILPVTSLTESCYQGMFVGCKNLISTPELPATVLADNCYAGMFQNCTSLTTPPELPATTLADGCYKQMFQGCTSLTTAPDLPATTLTRECYNYMFYNCSGLTTAPELPATILEYACYMNMFNNCTSLTTAPELPATSVPKNGYRGMFAGCTSLTTAPELPATEVNEYSYNAMFGYCTSLTTVPLIQAPALADNCCGVMFRNCTSLNYIKCLTTDFSATDCLTNWLLNVPTTGGTFVKAQGANWSRGRSGIPTGWTVEEE